MVRSTAALILVSGLALAACGGTDKAGNADTASGTPDAAEAVGTNGDAKVGEVAAPDVCMPQCEGKECGDDGCGGSCGECTSLRVCGLSLCDLDSGHCVEVNNPCHCSNDSVCDDLNPCTTDTCNPDTCCCEFALVPDCCTPACDGKHCGDDGCGGLCGGCQAGFACKEGHCSVLCNPGTSAGLKTEGAHGMVWVAVPSGCYIMGGSSVDPECGAGPCQQATPPHEVSVAPFEMLETEVTEEQYEAVMGLNPSCDYTGVSPPCDGGDFGGPNSPVECVRWSEAKAFCEAVGGRLPSEAEWEYAARGGTNSTYSCGENSCLLSAAWTYTNAGCHKHDVRLKLPNGYGLYDVTGNVWEWVEDCFHSSYLGAPAESQPAWTTKCFGTTRGIRGGGFGWFYCDQYRIAMRNFTDPESPTDWRDIGFRCVRSPGQ